MQNKKGWVNPIEIPSLLNTTLGIYNICLTLPYSEHLGATCGAYTLSRRLAILHSYGFSIFHFSLGPALYTVGLHPFTSLLFGWYER